MKSHLHYIAAAMVALGSTAILVGCGSGGGGGGGGTSTGGSGATATIMLANTSSARLSSTSGQAAAFTVSRAGGGPVDISEILSLTVTITEIYFQYCGDEDEDDVPEVVLVKDNEFDPPSITIEQGETVRWKWVTDTEHTITSGATGDPDAGSLFDESASGTGSTVDLIFADLGPFPYFSNFEDDITAGMAGIVNVEPDDDGEDDDDRALRSHGHGHDDDDEDEDAGHLPVFSGSFDVDLLDLTALSQVLTTAQIPATEYCGIRLSIENPRLVLVDDPDTVITNVHLTANGRLFAKEHFEIEEGVDVLVIVDFGGIHLVKAGNSGKYVLTPQLKVDVQIVDAATAFTGDIVAIDSVNRIITVQTATETTDVAVGGGTTIASDDDADDAADTGAEVALAFEDLAVGQTVAVEGLLTVAGPVNANSITVADEDIVTNEVALDGAITAVDLVTGVIQVQVGADTFGVAVGVGTVITTDDDADDAADTGVTRTLALANLAVGQTVSIQGLLITGGPIDALTILVADASIDTTVI